MQSIFFRMHKMHSLECIKCILFTHLAHRLYYRMYEVHSLHSSPINYIGAIEIGGYTLYRPTATLRRREKMYKILFVEEEEGFFLPIVWVEDPSPAPIVQDWFDVC